MKEKAFMGRAYKSKASMNNEQLKQGIEKYGLTYEVKHPSRCTTNGERFYK